MKAEFDIKYTDGLDNITDLLETAISLGVIHKKSSWYYFDIIDDEGVVLEEKKWNGRAKLDEEVRDSEELQNAIRTRLMFDEDEEGQPSGWDDIE